MGCGKEYTMFACQCNTKIKLATRELENKRSGLTYASKYSNLPVFVENTIKAIYKTPAWSFLLVGAKYAKKLSAMHWKLLPTWEWGRYREPDGEVWGGKQLRMSICHTHRGKKTHKKGCKCTTHNCTTSQSVQLGSTSYQLSCLFFCLQQVKKNCMLHGSITVFLEKLFSKGQVLFPIAV